MLKQDEKVDNIERELATMKEKLNKMEADLNIQEELKNRLSDLESRLENTLDTTRPLTVEDNVQSYASVVKKTVTEISEREERGSNVVIRGLPESSADARQDRFTEDKNNAIAVLQHLNPQITGEDVLNIFRTGKKLEDRPRLAIVKLRNADIRSDVLLNARRGKTPIPGGIKVRPDLTKAERADEDDFFTKLAEAKAANPNADFHVTGPPGSRRYHMQAKNSV